MAKFRIVQCTCQQTSGIENYKYFVQVKSFWGWRYIVKYQSCSEIYINVDEPFVFQINREECFIIIEMYKKELNKKRYTYEYIE